GAPPAAVGGDLVARGRGRVAAAAGVDGEHEDLTSEALGDLGEQRGPGDRGGVDAPLARSGPQQAVDVLHRAHPAPDGQRHEDLLGGAGDDVQRGRAALRRGGDVEEGDLVGALGAVAAGQLDRVPGVAEVLELDPFDDASGVDVEAGDHTYGHTHRSSIVTAGQSVSAGAAGGQVAFAR